MDRKRLSTILLLVGVFFLVYTLVGKGCGKNDVQNTASVQERFEPVKLPEGTAIGAPCVIETGEFIATIGAIGGGLQGFSLKGEKYKEKGVPIDLAHRTTINVQGEPIFEYSPLRAEFRSDLNLDNQVPGDLVQYTVEKPDASTCVLRHKTPDLVEIVRTVKTTARKYELAIETTVTNLAAQPKRHAFSEALFALQFKKDEGSMFKRPGANDVFGASCGHDGGKIDRKSKGDLRGWYLQRSAVDFVAISTAYLGQVLLPEDQGAHCALVAQDMGTKDSDTEQSLFRAVLAYEPKELAPSAAATYKQLAFLGPKERHILAAVGGGTHHVDQLVDLGYFSFIAKYLVSYVVFLQRLIGSWGLAIVTLTLTVRMALLPLTLPQIKSSIAMRRLKPELDILNKKFEGDQQAKMLATSQLYKKHGVNPLSGCLPAVLQMPVWFALYTSLQTAIELYHEHFLFWSDLAAPDPRYILPLVLGATMFLQQKVTPMQMDPAQQKVFTYFMPAMFTVFMLFLPVGLGIYMLTNSVLGIVQTVAVERYMKSQKPTEIKVEVTTKPKGEKDVARLEKKPRPASELVRRPKDEPEA